MSCNKISIGGKLVLDPTAAEEMRQENAVVVAMMPQFGEITQISQFGVSDIKQCTAMINTCISGCVEVHKLMKNHFVEIAKKSLDTK